MTKFLTFAAVVIGFGATAMVGNSNQRVTATGGAEVRFATDGAFRDGLYLGKLAAQSGQRSRPAIGRWALEQDRVMFAAGYQRGYGERQ